MVKKKTKKQFHGRRYKDGNALDRADYGNMYRKYQFCGKLIRPFKVLAEMSFLSFVFSVGVSSVPRSMQPGWNGAWGPDEEESPDEGWSSYMPGPGGSENPLKKVLERRLKPTVPVPEERVKQTTLPSIPDGVMWGHDPVEMVRSINTEENRKQWWRTHGGYEARAKEKAIAVTLPSCWKSGGSNGCCWVNPHPPLAVGGPAEAENGNDGTAEAATQTEAAAQEEAEENGIDGTTGDDRPAEENGYGAMTGSEVEVPKPKANQRRKRQF